MVQVGDNGGKGREETYDVQAAVHRVEVIVLSSPIALLSRLMYTSETEHSR